MSEENHAQEAESGLANRFVATRHSELGELLEEYGELSVLRVLDGVKIEQWHEINTALNNSEPILPGTLEKYNREMVARAARSQRMGQIATRINELLPGAKCREVNTYAGAGLEFGPNYSEGYGPRWIDTGWKGDRKRPD